MSYACMHAACMPAHAKTHTAPCVHTHTRADSDDPGDMIRGPDEEVISVLSTCALKELHPIMRALAIRSLSQAVLVWEPALIRSILPCLVDLEAAVRKAAVEALLLKVAPGDEVVRDVCISFLHAPVVGDDADAASAAASVMSSLRQRSLRLSVLQVLRRVVIVGDEDAVSALVSILLEENRKSEQSDDPEDSSSQAMQVYHAAVEALGFVVAGAERGLVVLLTEELKVARMIDAMREAARPDSRAGQRSRGSGSSRSCVCLHELARWAAGGVR